MPVLSAFQFANAFRRALRGSSRRRQNMAAAVSAELLESRQLLSVTATTLMDLEQAGQGSSGPGNVVFGSQLAWFLANTAETGRELWRTDGTTDGTFLLRDLVPGPDGSYVDRLVVAGDVAFIRSGSPFPGEQLLWRSDGSRSGTERVRFADGQLVLNPDTIVAGHGFVYFASDRGAGRQLYRLAATPEATPQLIVTEPSAALPYRENAGVVTDTAAYFPGPRDGADRLVVVPHSQNVAYDLGEFDRLTPVRDLGGRLLFSARPKIHQPGATPTLWITDGSPQQTHSLNLSMGVFESSITSTADGSLLFLVKNSESLWEVWKSDGSANGAALQLSVGAGTNEQPFNTDNTTAADGKIYFRSDFGAGAGDIWVTDGTTSGTFIVSNAAGLTIRGLTGVWRDGVVFEARDSHNRPGVYVVSDNQPDPLNLYPQPNLNPSAGFAPTWVGLNQILFQYLQPALGSELFVSDGLSPMTLLKDIAVHNASSYPGRLIRTDVGVAFAYSKQSDNANGISATITDELTAGVPSSRADMIGLAALPDGTLFALQNSYSTELLTRPAGSDVWTRMQLLAPHADTFFAQLLAVAGDQLFYLSGQHSPALWVTDGTENGTRLITDGQFGIADMSDFAELGHHGLLFERSLANGSRELWISDGTAEGTLRLLVLGTTNRNNDFATTFQRIGNRMLFVDGVGNFVMTDGTPNGTSFIPDMATVFPAGRLHWFGQWDGVQYFSATAANGDQQIWSTDGTVAGTKVIRSWAEQEVVGQIEEGITAGGRLYFTVRSSDQLADLWVSDGSGPGTRILKRNLRESGITSPYDEDSIMLFDEYGKLFFRAAEGRDRAMLWMTDGTPAGTVALRTRSNMPVPYFEGNNYFGDYLAADSLVGFRGSLYYGGITNEFGDELIRLTPDAITDIARAEVERCGDELALNWTEVFGADAYEIQFIDLTRPGAQAQTYHVIGGSWVLPEAAQNGLFRIWIRGTRSDGDPGPWNTKPIDITLGDVPVIHTVTGVRPGQTVELFWAQPIGTTVTEVWVNDLDSGKQVFRAPPMEHRSRMALHGLPPSRYAAWVKTSGDYGVSDWSEVNVFNVLAAAPADVVVHADADRMLTISWDQVPDSSGYEVFVLQGGRSQPYLQQILPGTIDSYRLPQPVPGAEYSVWVRARRSGHGYSEWSSVQTVFVRQAPNPTLQLPTIRWQTIGAAIGYQLQVTDLRIGQIVAEGRPTEPSFTVDLSPGPYRLRIRTLYANGEVSEWNQRDFEIFRPAVSVVPPAATVDATPVVQWMVQSGADHYQVQVTDRSGQVLSYRSVGIRETDHRIATPLPPGEYQLWVRSHYSDGSRSLWGMGVSLSIGAAPHVTFANGTLNWNRPVGTTSFEILLQRQNPDDLRWTTVVETDYYFQTSLPVRSQPAGQYRFWGRATRSEAGDTYFSNWSRLVRFELV